MGDPTPQPRLLVESARAVCRGCAGPLVGRQKVACSGKCRAKASRRWRQIAGLSRDEEIRALLETALKKLGERP
jgi:hypothetical protein